MREAFIVGYSSDRRQYNVMFTRASGLNLIVKNVPTCDIRYVEQDGRNYKLQDITEYSHCGVWKPYKIVEVTVDNDGRKLYKIVSVSENSNHYTVVNEYYLRPIFNKDDKVLYINDNTKFGQLKRGIIVKKYWNQPSWEKLPYGTESDPKFVDSYIVIDEDTREEKKIHISRIFRGSDSMSTYFSISRASITSSLVFYYLNSNMNIQCKKIRTFHCFPYINMKLRGYFTAISTLTLIKNPIFTTGYSPIGMYISSLLL
jgi:hypothetical protein